MLRRPMTDKRGWPFWVGASILKPILVPAVSRNWVDADKIPTHGGVILVLNHISHVDPLMSAHFVYDHGRIPRYLAKAGLFKVKVLGPFLAKAGQIPVERLTSEAVGAFDAAVAAVNAGNLVVVYPEGTITKDPDGWPMRGKSGAARIALATGAPVIPVGQWGSQELLPAYSKKPDFFPRKQVTMVTGDPVDLSDLHGELTPHNIKVATDRIMAAITGLVEGIRGETAPAVRFDPKAAGVNEIGNPDKHPPAKDPHPNNTEGDAS